MELFLCMLIIIPAIVEDPNIVNNPYRDFILGWVGGSSLCFTLTLIFN